MSAITTLPDVDAAVRVHPGRGPNIAALAAALVRRKYSERGYHVPPAVGRGDEIVLLARFRGHIQGTLTLRADDGRLQAEDAYPDEVARLRAQGLGLAELTRFAIDAPSGNAAILSALMREAWRLAHAHPAIHCTLIEVHPRHAAFYQRRYGFRVIGPARCCPRAGAPCVLLALRLARKNSATRRSSPREESDRSLGLTCC